MVYLNFHRYELMKKKTVTDVYSLVNSIIPMSCLGHYISCYYWGNWGKSAWKYMYYLCKFLWSIILLNSNLKQLTVKGRNRAYYWLTYTRFGTIKSEFLALPLRSLLWGNYLIYQSLILFTSKKVVIVWVLKLNKK